MKIMKYLRQAGIGIFLIALMTSFFAMQVTSADKGYVGEDVTIVELVRKYQKQPTYH